MTPTAGWLMWLDMGDGPTGFKVVADNDELDRETGEIFHKSGGTAQVTAMKLSDIVATLSAPFDDTAPDLLAALKTAWAVIESSRFSLKPNSSHHLEMKEAGEICFAAIAKATTTPKGA